jgi:RimJ/RimL family protein N-acetyltransferase
MTGPTLETERLILRPPSLADLDAWAAFGADAEAVRFIGGAQGRELTWRSVMVMAGAWTLHGFAMFSVVDKASGRWIGRIGPWRPEGWPGPEIAWGLARESWGKGYATEAAQACMDFAFDHLGWTEAIHTIDPANHASQAVARRLGSANRGPGKLPPPFEASPVDIWGQTREQWRARGR